MPARPLQFDIDASQVSRTRAEITANRLEEAAEAARAIGLPGWARDFERQSRGIRAMIPAVRD